MCDSPFYVTTKDGRSVPVPCGKCPPCKHRRVNSWVFRLLQEDKRSSSAHFVTLTYDTAFVPLTAHGFMSLRKRDLQLYFKRLRKLCPDATIKYYAVGEYGSKNRRPHYHAIIFNVIDSEHFYNAWHIDGVPLGAVHVGKVSSDSIAYTLKYIDKPSRIPEHSRDDRIKEFSLMSKRMGDNYLTDEVKRYHLADPSRNYVTREGGFKQALPRYYRLKIYDEEERVHQQYLAHDAAMQRERDRRIQFHRMQYKDLTYEEWIELQKAGRHQQFYRNLKDRDI